MNNTILSSDAFRRENNTGSKFLWISVSVLAKFYCHNSRKSLKKNSRYFSKSIYSKKIPTTTNNTHNSSIRSDEGLTLETSAVQIVHGGNSTFINTFEIVWRYIPAKIQLSHFMFVSHFIVGLRDSTCEFTILHSSFIILHSSLQFYIRVSQFYIRVSQFNIRVSQLHIRGISSDISKFWSAAD